MEHINLLPPDIIERENRQTRIAVWSCISAAILIGLVIGAVVIRQKVQVVRDEVAELTKECAELETRIKRCNELKIDREKLRKRERIIDSLLDTHTVCLLFGELSQRTSSHIWIESASISEPLEARKAAIVGKSDDDADDETAVIDVSREVVLTGCATTNAELARFMTSLDASPHLRDATLSISKREAFFDGEATKFEIRMVF